MTATADALLAGILAAPADDAPRLVYADWLEENATADHVGPCPECGGKPRQKIIETNSGYRYQDLACRCAGRRFAVPGNGYAERAAHIRWAVANPQNSSVCLCLNGRRRPQPCETCQMMGAEVAFIPRRPDGETHYVLNRGFVVEVRGPLAVLVGGPCLGCDGRGGTQTYTGHGNVESESCDRCSGSGRTPGVLARLVREQPVEVVRVTDRRPMRTESGDEWVWYGCTAQGELEAEPGCHWVPERVRDLLVGGRRHSPYGRRYPTEAAATDALSAALLALARTPETRR